MSYNNEPRNLPTIASPCVRNCCLNEEDICLGCFRSLDEITGWYQADDAARRIILLEADRRKKDYKRLWGPDDFLKPFR